MDYRLLHHAEHVSLGRAEFSSVPSLRHSLYPSTQCQKFSGARCRIASRDKRFYASSSRRDLRAIVDRLPRFQDPAIADPAFAYDEYYRQGYELISTPEAQRAFDIHEESDEVRDAYGRNGFGQRALLARRLVEAGVPFITLYDGGWDHHSNLFDALRKRLPTWDQTVATLIQDLDRRGLFGNDDGDRSG